MVANSKRRDVFQALADPTRRALILLLATQAMTPHALADQFQVSRQAISKHLRILTECEIVQQEFTGREIHYHLQPMKLKAVEQWLVKFRQLTATRFNQLDDVLIQLKKKRK